MPAKSSGARTTLCDLDSYHISLNEVDPLQFFGLEELPQPSVDQELLDNFDADTMENDRNIEVMDMLDIAMACKNAVDDFVIDLFRVMGFFRGRRAGHRRTNLPLVVRGKTRHVGITACVMDHSQNDILLLVQEDKGGDRFSQITARAQLVAGAVAAFNENNLQREALGRPALTHKVMPGIVMFRTLPTFFKIPVTKTLSDHIRSGTYPPEETVVTYCDPPVPRPGSWRTEGMKPLDNRREILRSYEAFKAIVGI